MNMPVAIEYHVDWIADCIEYMREHGWSRVEATEEAQDAWVEHVAEVGQTLALRAGELLVRGREHPRKAPGGDALRGRTAEFPRALRRGQRLGLRRLRVRRGRTRLGQPRACEVLVERRVEVADPALLVAREVGARLHGRVEATLDPPERRAVLVEDAPEEAELGRVGPGLVGRRGTASVPRAGAARSPGSARAS